ncbi:14838_t:CDS:2, partial [Racocetra fulgida]
MSGLTSSLNTELLALAGESKRRNPEIKEAAERSVKILKTLKPGVDLPQDSKVLVVNNTAAATLRQLVINIFEKVQEEDEINDKN